MKPYTDPKMRRKMSAMPMPSDAPANPMEESSDPAPAASEEPSPSEKPTAFLSKDMGGGKVWKAGDEIVLRIKAVDPESGELQVEYAPEKPGESDEPADTMSAMDQAMPETQDGGY